MADVLTLDLFRPLVGRSFRLSNEDGVELRLSAAEPLPAPKYATAVPLRASFELIFLGPKTPLLPQMIHRMETEGVDPLEIFIVPIGPIEDAMGYQAIFN